MKWLEDMGKRPFGLVPPWPLDLWPGSKVVLISRQFIETLPEMEELKMAISGIVGPEPSPLQPRFEEVEQQLPATNLRPLFKRLPRVVQRSLIWRRDSRGPSDPPVRPVDVST